jgi:hypothetical protein
VVFCYGLLFTLTYAVWVDGGLWTLAHPEIAKQPVKQKIVPWRQARNDDVFSR